MVAVTSSVRRSFIDSEPCLAVMIKCDLPADEVAGQVKQIADQFREALDDVDRASPVEFARLPKGPAIVFTDLSDDDYAAVLDRLAQRLTTAGLGDATVTALPTVSPYGGPRSDVQMIKCFMTLKGQRPPNWDPGPAGIDLPEWAVTEADRAAVLAYLGDWALALPDAQLMAVSVGPELSPVGAGDALRLLRFGLADPDPWRLTRLVVGDRGGRLRVVDLRPGLGMASAAEVTIDQPDTDWTPVADRLVDLLAHAGDWCAYGHVTRGISVHALGASPWHGDRQWNGRLGRFVGDYPTWPLTGRLFDAFGVMRVPPGIAPVLDRSDFWTTQQLSTGDTLAVADDISAWLLQPLATVTLDAAREQLGHIIVDPENV